ncbi:MAG TPA: sugar transferase [Acidimicrobiales bacterium]|nr:sugar transferase [Acidimicrobiales bacterium]
MTTLEGTRSWVPEAVPRATTSAAEVELAKRVFDVVMAATLLVVMAPLLVVLALAVGLTSPGPVLFRQRRVGRDGVGVDVLKFRTMRRDAEAMLLATPDLLASYVKSGYKLPAGQDPRVTPVGRLVRRFDLDELPQLWNVVRGQMSLVGPRPVPEAELVRYGEYRHYYEAVRPGMTGLWQVSGRNRLPYAERIALDVDYVERLSVGRDVSILARTLPAMLRGGGRNPCPPPQEVLEDLAEAS